ncbi:hypothetical protein [Nocardia sp. NBC_01329]|uniref:hypothetical protein n=1 Tax=Nocardia sp. NBC_01329 TaxID=2903594 RepID=UPI002E13A3B9|nr:hypothetical protein OG405_20130 [Nocardia sp. NBC_01329]
MTDIDDEYEYEPEADEVAAPPRKTIYEVFNPEGSVGVACDRDGEIVGMHITDEAREGGDPWLAAEIVKLAKLAHMQSRVGLRKEMESKGTRPYTIDSFGLPTEAAYRALENETFGTRAH